MMNTLYKKSEYLSAFIFLVLALVNFLDICLFNELKNKIYENIYSGRILLYPQLLVCFSVFFGFILSSITIIISIHNAGAFDEFKKTSDKAIDLWESYTASLKYLGLVILSVTLLVILDINDAQNTSEKYHFLLTALRWLTILLTIKVVEKVFWCFYILTFLIETIKTDWENARRKYILEQEENAKVPEDELKD